MPPTERLYYQDSHLIEFDARVIDRTERVSGWTAVTLDRTLSTQLVEVNPATPGINGLRVVECIDDEEEGVLHVIQGKAPDVGTLVKGRVDWLRRLDHMRNTRTAHSLAVIRQTFKAPTRSFRVLEESCEIDVDLDTPTQEVIERAVELANNVIWENRMITISRVTPEEASELPLRKAPAREGDCV